jgi:hypothetical protein
MAVDDSGNQRIAFEWGNVPMQPNDDRDGIVLGSKGIHEINGVAWDMYPQHNGSRNYMITAAKALGGSNYEYTSQNELIVGEQVHISGCGWANSTSPYVTYADLTKFRTSDDLADSTALTGLKGRVDVIETDTGHTLVDGDPLYLVPSYTFCWSNPKTKDGNVWDYIEYLRAAGVDPDLLKDATFLGGENEYDWGTIGDYGDRDSSSGIIFWDYIPADVIVYIDWETGTVYTGKDFHETITYVDAPGAERAVDASWNEHVVVAFTNDPSKNNTADWWY